MSALSNLVTRAPAVASLVRTRLLTRSDVVVGNVPRVIAAPKVSTAIKAAQTASSRKPALVVAAAAVAGGVAVSAADFASSSPEEAMAIVAALTPEEQADFLNQLNLTSDQAQALLDASDTLTAVGNAYQVGETAGRDMYGVSEADRQPNGMAKASNAWSTWTQDERQRYTRMMASVLALFGGSPQSLENAIVIMSMTPQDRSYLYDELNAQRF